MDITKDQLAKAMATWKRLHRSGGCASYEDAAAKPVDVVAQKSADYLWSLLANAQSTT